MDVQTIKCVDLIRPDNRPAPGLVSVRGATLTDRLDEKSVILEAAAFHRVDYVFFRRFQDDRSSQVAAFVVDNSDEQLTEHDLARLHHQLWLHGSTPLVYVAWPTRVDILTCARGPDFWADGRTLYKPAHRVPAAASDAVRTAADVAEELREKQRRFSARRLADGTFWDDPRNSSLANDNRAAHKKLIQAIVEADNDLKGETKPIRRRLLVLTVLIKYLEDRRVFPDGWFGSIHTGAETFFDVLREGTPTEFRRLLAKLKRKFNGEIFAWADQAEEVVEKELRQFAELIEAKTLGGQRHFWSLFSFEHLPVEVISRLYQRFVRGGHGVVYTPPFLASLLLDHAMPYDKLTGRERVLDPACGSGVFLVGAFKRLVNVWRHSNNWRPPDVTILKEILKRSIFGVELEASAVDLTAFSLALAVCDALKPNVIWNELRFEPLRGGNLREGDFFSLSEDSSQDWPQRFEVIVGNPPFESELTLAGRKINSMMASARGDLPDEQAAYLFLEQAIQTLQPQGRLCLIQPSGLLYNSKAADFRRTIFEQARVGALLDFTSIRGLYDGADPKTVAVLAEADQPTPNDWVTHLTFRRTFSAYRQIGFELDHYDRHRVQHRVAIDHPFVWRANLLGGSRLVEMSTRIRHMRSLAEFVAARPNWDYGEGFIAGKSGERDPAPFLTGKPLLPTKAFDENGIDESKITTVRDTLFKSAYSESRYSPPLVLIKENDSLPLAFWDKGFLAYRAKIVGIHADPNERQVLRALYAFLRDQRHLYQFCCTLNGSQVLVGKATAILKQDIDALPFPEDQSELEFSFWEQALREDVLKHMVPFVRLGQKSRLLRDPASIEDVRWYASLFCRMLGTVYRNLKAHDPVVLNGLIAMPFYFGRRPAVEWLTKGTEEQLNRLVYDEEYASLRTVRVVRFYAENVMVIVKPDRLRYWIPSTAIRDADESLLDLRRQGW